MGISVQESVAEDLAPRRVVFHPTTGSTNDDAKALAAEGAPHGTVVWANAQTKGRGRGDHTWYSPPSENVYLSIVLRPKLTTRQLPALSLAFGLAVAQVVDRYLVAPRAMIKWPNDVFVDEKKIAGVLVESQLRGGAVESVVVGVGLNRSTREFPADLAARATSLFIAGFKGSANLQTSLVLALESTMAGYESRGFSSFLEELRARDFLRGRRIRVNELVGIGDGIDPEGGLWLRDATEHTHHPRAK